AVMAGAGVFLAGGRDSAGQQVTSRGHIDVAPPPPRAPVSPELTGLTAPPGTHSRRLAWGPLIVRIARGGPAAGPVGEVAGGPTGAGTAALDDGRVVLRWSSFDNGGWFRGRRVGADGELVPAAPNEGITCKAAPEPAWADLRLRMHGLLDGPGQALV